MTVRFTKVVGNLLDTTDIVTLGAILIDTIVTLPCSSVFRLYEAFVVGGIDSCQDPNWIFSYNRHYKPTTLDSSKEEQWRLQRN